MNLTPHIEKFRRRFAEVEAVLSDPKVFDNPQRAQELSREYARLKEFVTQGESYLKTLADLDENRVLLKSEPAQTASIVNRISSILRTWLKRKPPAFCRSSVQADKMRAAKPFSFSSWRTPRRRRRSWRRAAGICPRDRRCPRISAGRCKTDGRRCKCRR